jgi:hypothetical protein
LISGWAGIPLTENGLVIGKDAAAGMDDIGVGRVTGDF